MILQSLHLEQFKQYSQLDISFQEGLVGIVGKNGAGKSSIFEAVLLCLFGKTITDKAFYKTSWAPPKTATILELHFELNHKVYRVRREFRGKQMAHHAYLYDPKDELIANGASPVTGAIAQLIGLDRDAFMRSVFSGQKELGIISNTRGEERKKMVRRMVGLDKLDRIQQLVRDDRNIKKREIQGQEHLLFSEEKQKEVTEQLQDLNTQTKQQQEQLKQNEGILAQKNTAYQNAKKHFDQLNAQYKTYNQLQQQLAKWEENLLNLQQRQVAVQQELETLQQSKSKLQELTPAIQMQQKTQQHIEQLEQQRQSYEQRQQLLIQKKSLEEQLQKYQTQIALLPELTTKGTQLNEALVQVQQRIAPLQQQQPVLEAALASNQSAMGSIQGRIKERQGQLKQITDLGAEAQCPTCLQPLVHSYQSTLDRLQSEIATYEQQELQTLIQQQTQTTQQLSTLKSQLLTLQGQQQELENQRQVLREQFKQCKAVEVEAQELEKRQQSVTTQINSLAKIAFDPKELEQAQAQIKALAPQLVAYNKLEQQLERLPILKEENQQLAQRIEAGKQGITQQKADLQTLSFSELEFEKAKGEMDRLEGEKDQQQATVKQLTTTLHQVEQALSGLQRDLKNQQDISQKIAANQTAFRELELLDELFSNFKNQMLIRIRPTIKSTAGRLFEQITRGRYEGIEVDDNFEFHIFENGQSYPIQRFSGGEIDLANLCLRIGISKAIAELSGSEVAMNFLAFDEIFGSQDEERRFEILLALDHLKEQYRQIYIISHIDTIKEHFPSILEVRKTENGSVADWR